MLKNTNQNFRILILKLINLTIKQSKLPTSWKESIITMIPKKQVNSSNPKDYRPISLTSCLAKLAEKLIAIKLKDFLDKNKLILKQQSGFRKNRQTRDNIFHITQKIIESFNRKKKVCAIFFDIASAFDKVWHRGLIYKMIKLKIPNYIIYWINDFLSNRYFAVKINEFISCMICIEAGVPQGAVLSPTLFSIFINDLPINYKKNKQYSLLFADDLASIHIFKKQKRIQFIIQNYLNLIEKWLIKWRLLMAPTKCSYLIFTTSTKSESDLMTLQLFNTKLAINDNPTFLGIRFDHHLTFRNQQDYLKDACIRRLNILKILSNKSWGLTIQTLTQLYTSLIRSLLEYSSIIYPRFSYTNFENLEKLQCRCLKVIYKKSKYESNRFILDLSTIETLKERFDYLNLNYINKSLINNNELLIDLYKEYIGYRQPRQLKYKTLFCNYVNEIKYHVSSTY